MAFWLTFTYFIMLVLTDYVVPRWSKAVEGFHCHNEACFEAPAILTGVMEIYEFSFRIAVNLHRRERPYSEAYSRWAGEEISCLFWNLNICYRDRRKPLLASVPNKMGPANVLTTHFFKLS
jgi:hypothetical protein